MIINIQYGIKVLNFKTEEEAMVIKVRRGHETKGQTKTGNA